MSTFQFPPDSRWRSLTHEDFIPPWGRRAYVYANYPPAEYDVPNDLILYVSEHGTSRFLASGDKRHRHAAVLKEDDMLVEAVRNLTQPASNIESDIIEGLKAFAKEIEPKTELVWVDATSEHVGMECRVRDLKGDSWGDCEHLLAIVDSSYPFVTSYGHDSGPSGWRYCQVQVPKGPRS